MANGILEWMGDPANMGLLNLSSGLLESSGPSLMPVSFGQALSRGVQRGLQGAQMAQQQQQQNALQQARLAELQRKAKEAEQFAGIRSAILARYGMSAQAPGQAPGVTEGPGLSPNSAAALGAPWAARQPGSQMPATPQGVPDGFNGVSPDAALLMLSGNDSFAKLGTAIQEAAKPTPKIREALALGLRPGTQAFNNFVGTQFNQGGAWQVDPATGALRLAPGYAEGMGAVRGAEAGATAAYDVIQVPDGRGGTVMMPRSLVAQQLGGGQVPVQQPQAPRPTSVVTQRVEARPAGGGLGYTRPAAESGADAAFQKSLAEDFGKQYVELQRADFNAPANMAKYQRLQGLLSGVRTGKFTSTTTQLKAAAKSVGIDLGALGVADDVAPAQAALALSNQLAIELRNPAGGAGMPGALSDKDREFLVQMVPGLENDPEAIPLMIEYRMKLAQREQQVAKMARAYKKKSGKFDDGFYDELAEWSNKNPLFKEADRKKVPNSEFRVIGSRPAN